MRGRAGSVRLSRQIEQGAAVMNEVAASNESVRATDAVPPGRRKRLYVAFEGGGAKGVVHVGALKAIERYEPEFLGFSGTSAGAIVAALAAAHFSADDMVDTEQEKTLLDVLNQHYGSRYHVASDLFGAAGWKAMLRFQRLIGPGLKYRALLAALAIVIATCVTAAWVHWAAGVALFIAITVLVGWWLLRLYRGVTALEQFCKAMDDALAIRFPGIERPIRFQHFKDARKPELNIVATNIAAREMQVFNARTTPFAPVAEAVAASVCIPLVFKPREFEKGTYLDGGLVSNLPAWVFDEERSLDPDAVTIAVEIRDPPAPQHEKPARDWLEPALRTSIFGRGGLNKRVNGRLISLPMSSRLGLLEFDAKLGSKSSAPGAAVGAPARAASKPERATVIGEVEQARDAALFRLWLELEKVPEVLDLAVEEIGKEVLRELVKSDSPVPLSRNQDARVRVALAIPPPGHVISLRLEAHAGFDGEPDQGMLLPIAGSYAGKAFASGEMVLVQGQQLQQDRDDRDQPAPVRRVVDRAWPRMQWSLSVPIPAPQPGQRPASKLVVIIDSDCPIDGAGLAAFRDFKTLMRGKCERILIEVVKQLEARSQSGQEP
ncbi:MAG: hypothetical protein NVS9B10_24210 [Nevskia sp.]